jgi:hypothetical protein
MALHRTTLDHTGLYFILLDLIWMDLTGINENGTELELDLSELEWIVLGRN